MKNNNLRGVFTSFYYLDIIFPLHNLFLSLSLQIKV